MTSNANPKVEKVLRDIRRMGLAKNYDKKLEEARRLMRLCGLTEEDLKRAESEYPGGMIKIYEKLRTNQ